MNRECHLYTLKVHDEVRHLALDSLQRKAFLLNECAIEENVWPETAIYPALVSINGHEIGAGECRRTVQIEVLNRDTSHFEGLGGVPFGRTSNE